VLLFALAAVLGAAAGYGSFGESRDYINYITFYENIDIFNERSFLRFEPGFLWISIIFQTILNARVEIMLTVLAAFSLFAKFLIFSEYPRRSLTILFYLCCFYPLHEYTQVRTALAMAFCMFAANAFFNNRFVLSAILVLAGSLFHSSLIIFGLAIPAAWMLSSLRMAPVVATVLAGGVSMGFLSQSLLSIAERLNPLTSFYAANLSGSVVNLFSAVNIATVALLTVNILAGSVTDRRTRTYFILVLFGFALAVAFQSIPAFSQRLREMFLVFTVPLAFNAKRTPLGLLQMSIAVLLAGGYLYAHLIQGIIGT
jgi:hypothetical protein